MEKVQLENTDFEGLNDVYILRHGGGTTLIDAGMNTPEMYEQLTAGLRAAGTSVEEVDRVLLTHWHPDHVGLAGDVKRESGATVYIHEEDAPLVREPAWRQMEPLYTRLFEEWGMPAAKRERLEERLDLEDDVLSGECIDVETVVDGDEFEVGEMTLEVVHAPGHTAGLSGFAFDGDEGRELFSGDALLPVYTPNVGGADIRVEHPLERYLETLVRLIGDDYARAWPGHRDVIEDPSGRAREIIAHHRDRTRKILDILGEEPTDTWTVSERLFGELDDIHILHGPGEAYAHLEHLTRYDAVERTPEGYVRREDATFDPDEAFPAVDAPAAE
ncbi:MAG: MBL fold metallo-hydrolase [Salinigranum sp.]